MASRIASLVLLALALPTAAQELRPPFEHACEVDLDRVGQMADILSNALTRGLDQDSREVREFLGRTRGECADGEELLRRTAAGFALDEARLRAEVERFHHVNCWPVAPAEEDAEGEPAPPLSTFAADVTVHVVLHEIGHALVREFDLPVLGNEETLADAFATHYLVTHLPERAPAVLLARVESLMFEAAEVPREAWTVGGEHDSDARRAHQIAALAIAADAERYRVVAAAVGMSQDHLAAARDWGTEVHRSWRRVLRPLWMPEGLTSSEVDVDLDLGRARAEELRASGVPAELEAALRRFDWHSNVTLRFAGGDGGAGWSRSKRAITVRDGYLSRFVAQGAALER